MTKHISTSTIATPAEIDEYFANLPETTGEGRLIFGLDATASRQPTWDAASALQAEMFQEGAGDLDIKLVYYRGDECKASGWISDGRRLSDMMRRITCESGLTQIRRLLAHAVNERNFSAAKSGGIIKPGKRFGRRIFSGRMGTST